MQQQMSIPQMQPMQQQHNMCLPPPMQPAALLGSLQQIPMIQAQMNMIKEQINQSESNLNAQREAFKVKTKSQIDEMIKKKAKHFVN